MGNPLTDREFVRFLDNRLKKVYNERYEGLPLIIDKFFNRVTDKSAWIEFSSIGDIPDPTLFNGNVSYQGVAPGYVTKITPLEYAGGIIIERRLLDTDKTGMAEKKAGGLAEAANRKMNKLAHEPFIYHDSSAFTFMSTDEGVALCSDSHLTKASGVSTSSGFDNLSTLAFDAPNLEALRIISLGFKSDIGERITTNFDTIVHGSNLTEAVWNVTHASGRPDDMSNDMNIHKGRWKTIELPLLDDYDTNDWFIVDSSKMKEALIWQDGVPLEFNSTTDFDTFMRKYSDYFVVGWGWNDWRWILGSSVS